MNFFIKALLFMSLVISSQALDANELLPLNQLSPFWKNYFEEVDQCIEENFWGNLSIYKKTLHFQDPYIAQLIQMGYSFEEGSEHPASFYDSLQWVFQQINGQLAQGILTDKDLLFPAKAFEVDGKILFIPIGAPVPSQALPLNLLTPQVFVDMLGSGYFPIGNAHREHTNQALAEHDLAHMAGFISSLEFTKAIREAFRRVAKKMKDNPRVTSALQNFDSAYSLRLYYTIEVFTHIPSEHLPELQQLIQIPLDRHVRKEEIDEFLLKKAQNPIELYRYLAKIYNAFHRIVNPLGGESRDIFNRNSLYSIFLNAKAALENERSNHPDYWKSITEIHSPVIGALIGTSQLKIDDWVLECIQEVPTPSSKLYNYIDGTGFWNQNHILHRAFLLGRIR